MKRHLDYTTVQNKLKMNDKNMTRFILAYTVSKHPAFNTGKTHNVVKKIQLMKLKNLVWKKTSKCYQEKI